MVVLSFTTADSQDYSSSSEDTDATRLRRDSEDSDHVLVVGGPKERYQDEPLAVDEDNDDSRSWRKCEDDDGLLNPVCIRGSIRTASGSCYMVNNAAFL